MQKIYVYCLLIVLTAFLCVSNDKNVKANDGIKSFANVKVIKYPLLTTAVDHYNKALVSQYKDKFKMNIFSYNEFLDNLELDNYASSFLGFDFAFVFTNCSFSNNLPQMQLHGYKGNQERIIVKIINCNNNSYGYYGGEIANVYEADNISYYLVSPDERSEAIAFEYGDCIVEIKFDNISFSQGSIQPLTTKFIKIERIDELIEAVQNSEMFSEKALLTYTNYIKNNNK